jgi:hypothetical protein
MEVAVRKAEGASPKKMATPVRKLNTPTQTKALTSLKIAFGMLAPSLETATGDALLFFNKGGFLI